MPRASSTHGTASGASTPEPAAASEAAAASAAALEPTSDLVSQPATASASSAAAPLPAAAAPADDDPDDDDGLDPLTQLELGAFGTDAVDDALPAPPRDPGALAGAAGGAPASGSAGAGAGTPAAAGQGAGTKRTLAASGPLARAKRPKNVKFSPAKTGKALARRSAASAVVGDGGPGAYQLPNHDYCDACGGKGHFLCCEGGCLRSFHFSCLEPPLELDEVPEDSWYCKTCRAQVNPPLESRHRFFGELITRVETENPKEFSLPGEIKGFFKNVAVGTTGEYIDAVEHRPPSKITGRAIGQEDRDGFRLKDKNGRPIICYNCDGAANPAQRRRIISCDFCDQHWHLDCLDPPMTGMPPPTRKWMCPLHSDIVVPRKRQPKQTQLVNVDRPYHPNNGDIVVVPRQEPQLQQEVDEMTVNRVRYQVPEQHIILDFWGRITGHKGQPAPPSKKSKGKSPRRRPSGWGSGDSSSLSDLTSSDESGNDAGRSSSRAAAAATAAASAAAPVKAEPSPLDSLALLAEVRYIDFLEQQQQPAQAVSNGTPAKAAASGTATPGRAHDLPPALPNSTQRRLPSRGLAPTASSAAGPSSASSTSARDVTKRPTFGNRPSVGGGAAFASPGASTTATLSRSRGGSPSVSPAPGKLADVAVESKEDLKALGHVRRLVAAQSKLKEGDAKRAAMLDYLEGALIVPRLQSVGAGPSATPWSRPWDDKPAGGAAAAAKKLSTAAGGSQASPLGSPALAAAQPTASSPATTGSASPAPVAAPASSTADAPAAATTTSTTSAAASTSAAHPAAAAASSSAPAPSSTSAAAPSANGAAAAAAAALPASPLPFSLPASSSSGPSPRAAAAVLAAAPVKKEDGDAAAGDAMDADAPAGAVNGGA